MAKSAPIRLALLLSLVSSLAGCLFRAHTVERVVTGAPLKTATQQELIDYVNREAAKVRSMQATVDIDTAVGGARKGKITEYEEIRGQALSISNSPMAPSIPVRPEISVSRSRRIRIL